MTGRQNEAPRRSDVQPRSAECRLGRTPANDEQITLMARALRRDRGLCLLDPARVTDPWRREVVEQIADEQLGLRPKEAK